MLPATLPVCAPSCASRATEDMPRPSRYATAHVSDLRTQQERCVTTAWPPAARCQLRAPFVRKVEARGDGGADHVDAPERRMAQLRGEATPILGAAAGCV